MNSALLSFPTALFMTINTMLGAGIFINTLHLATHAGPLSWCAYLVVGVLVFPLMYAIALITKHHPYGGFYYYALPLSTYAGCLSAWVYAIAKLASATLLMRIAATIIHTEWGLYDICSINTLNYILFLLFAIVNYYGVRIGWLIILFFLTCKLIPALYVISTGLTHYHLWQSPLPFPSISTFFSITTNCLYAFLGFETVCSISMHLVNSGKNTARVMIGAFVTTVTITVLYQWMAFLMLSSSLDMLHSYLDVFPALMSITTPSLSIGLSNGLLKILYSMIGMAALGGAYSIIFANAWNLYTLGHHNHLISNRLFTYKNQYGSPIFCILFEIFVCMLFLWITQGHGLLLQNIGVMGCIITFLITLVANHPFKGNNSPPITHWRYLFIAALISSFILLITTFYNVLCIKTNIPFFIIGFIVLSGSALYYISITNAQEGHL